MRRTHIFHPLTATQPSVLPSDRVTPSEEIAIMLRSTLLPAPRATLCTAALLVVLLATVLPAQDSGNTSVSKPSAQKPTKPDESATAAASLVQLNNALEGLAAKVSSAVVQILVTGYGSVHEEDRAHRPPARRWLGGYRCCRWLCHYQRSRRRRRTTHTRGTAPSHGFRPRRPRRQTPDSRSASPWTS